MIMRVPKGTKEAYEEAIRNNFPADWQGKIEVIEV